jgi:alpha-L-arabinofuranosidase
VVRGHKRSKKQLWLSFDEWNVWYRERNGDGKRQAAPHLLEEIYNLEDALLVGGIINTLIRKSDRVKVACLAQLVNVIAPIMTNSTGLFRQTIFYPYSWGVAFARGSALDLLVEAPTHEVAGVGVVRYVDVAGTIDPETGRSTLFLLNRDLDNAHKVEIFWEGPARRVTDSNVLTGSDLKAANSFEAPTRVAPQKAEKPVTTAEKTVVDLPPRSYTLVQWMSS